MRIIKPLTLGILTRPYQYRGQHHLGVAVLAMATLHDNLALVTEADLWKLAGGQLAEDEVLDLGIPKPCAEFLVSGKAWSHDAQEPGRVAVSARVGQHEKSLIVHGDRTWTASGMSRPGVVRGIPVDWRHTYGGPGVDDNEAGIGAQRDADGVWRVPNVEALERRITREGQAGEPVGFGPVSPVRPRRFQLAGGFDPKWLDNGFPGLPDTLDPHFFNAASADQWLTGAAQIEPGAEYEIWNMHPEQARLHGRLPAWRARCFIRFHEDEALHEIALRHTTAWFFPDRERVLLIYHGAAGVGADDASDVSTIMPALEALDAPARSPDHYRRVLAQRLPRDSGALYALRDKDLVPQDALGNADFRQAGSGVLERPQVVNQRTRAEALKRDMLARAREAGQDPADYDLDAGTMAPLASLDDLPEHARSMRRKARLMKVDLMRKRRESEARMKQAFKDVPQAGEAMAAAGGGAATAKGGPPRLQRDEGMARLRALARDSQAQGGAGIGAAQMQAMQDDAQAQLAQLYRLAAHHQAPAATAPGGRSVRMRRRVQGLMQGSRDLSGLDLTGVDLSGMDLSNANCRGVWLEGADLSGVTLAGADLTRAVLTRARVQDAVFDGAILDEANLGEALVRASTFQGASFRQTILDRAVFEQCRFTQAHVEGCVPAGLQLIDCRFERARFENVTFWQQAQLERVDFVDAVLHRVVWVECGLGAMNHEGSELTACAWVQSVFHQPPRFSRCRLVTCCAVQSSLDDADFTDSLLKECSFRGLDMARANFTGARLDSSDLSETDLRDARFVRADARGSLFMETDFTGADLRESDLIDAIMQKSDLRFADLSRANLFRADISQAMLDDSTKTHGAYVKLAKTLPKAPAGGQT